MKRFFILPLLMAGLVACSGNNQTENETGNHVAQDKPVKPMTPLQKEVQAELEKADEALAQCGAKNLRQITTNPGTDVCAAEGENYRRAFEKACNAGVLGEDDGCYIESDQ